MIGSYVHETPPTGAASPPISSAQSTSNLKSPKAYSCVLCSQRKVKCDKSDPCSNCRRKEVECVFRNPVPPRRRKRRSPEAALLSRLRRAEELLQSHGVTIDAKNCEREPADSHSDEMDVVTSIETRDVRSQPEKLGTHAVASNQEKGRLIFKEGQSLYLGNTLWKNLSDELHDPKEIFHASSEDEAAEEPNQKHPFTSLTDGGDLVFGSHPKKSTSWRNHPHPIHILVLWQTYLENVNPLTKILHTPTMQQQIIEASGNLHNISKAQDALMFAIYSITVTSMSDEDCQKMIGEARSTLLDRYTLATQQALLRVRFLRTSDIVVLQALVLFLLSMRPLYDPRTLWVLSGIAVRIGQRLGLHRDGVFLGLPVFETEMRRRLAWLIAILDGRSAQIAGQGASAISHGWNVELPSNVNDSDLDPKMQEPPVPYTGASEMIFCLVRYTVGQHFERAKMLAAFDGNWQKLSDETPVPNKDQQIDEIESKLENKFIKYCDPIVPLHLLAASVARSAVYSMRVMAHHPRQQPDGGIHMPQAERDELFDNCLKLIDYANLSYSMKSVQRYLWHTSSHFQWHAFIYILGELRFRKTGDQVDRAWRQVEEVFEHYPDVITRRKGNFNAAVGRLTMRAWEVREMQITHQQSSLAPSVRPNFINKLYSQETVSMGANLQEEVVTGNKPGRPDDHRPESSIAHVENAASANISNDNNRDFDMSLFSNSTPMDLTPIDWAVWDDVIKDFELQQADTVEDKLFT